MNANIVCVCVCVYASIVPVPSVQSHLAAAMFSQQYQGHLSVPFKQHFDNILIIKSVVIIIN